MSLQEQINQDLVQAMKDKNEVILSTLRLLKSAIKNVAIAQGAEPNDEEVITLIGREVKKRQEAVDQYTKADRLDLADRESKEAGILKQYLPEQMGDDELKGIIDKAIEQTHAQNLQDMGKVMAAVMPQIKGRADGSRVSALVQEALRHG